MNKVIAHTDFRVRTGRRKLVGPSFDEVVLAHKECERIAGRWVSALLGASFRFDVIDLHEWSDFFDVPWRARHP